MQGVRNLPLEEKVDLYNRAMELKESQSWGKRRIAREIGIIEPTIAQWIYLGHKPHTCYSIPDLNPSPELSYVIGVIEGDGCVDKSSAGHRIRLAVKDRDFVDEFNMRLAKITGTRYSVCRKGELYEVTGWGRLLYEYLKKLPKPPRCETVEQFPAPFIRGFFDAEGNVARKHFLRSIVFTSTDLPLLEYVKDLLLRCFSINSTIKLKSRKGSQGCFESRRPFVRTKNVYNLRVEGYDGVIKFAKSIGSSIERKRNRLDDKVKKLLRLGT